MIVKDRFKPKALVLDMDGTFFLGESLLLGALQLLDWLNENNLKFNFLTNNTSNSKADYVKKLTKLGVRPEDARIYTAGDATISYLKANYPDQKVFLVGKELKQALWSSINVVDADPEVLVFGL